MSFILSGTIYDSKAQGLGPPAGKFYATDANQIRDALLDIRDQFLTGVVAPLKLFDTMEVSGSNHGIILTSPNGTRWVINATNSGSLTLTSL